MPRQYQWSEDGKCILYLQDVGGDENYRLYAQPLDGSPMKCLTPAGARAQNLLTSQHYPNEVKLCTASCISYALRIAEGNI